MFHRTRNQNTRTRTGTTISIMKEVAMRQFSFMAAMAALILTILIVNTAEARDWNAEAGKYPRAGKAVTLFNLIAKCNEGMCPDSETAMKANALRGDARDHCKTAYGPINSSMADACVLAVDSIPLLTFGKGGAAPPEKKARGGPVGGGRKPPTGTGTIPCPALTKFVEKRTEECDCPPGHIEGLSEIKGVKTPTCIRCSPETPLVVKGECKACPQDKPSWDGNECVPCESNQLWVKEEGKPGDCVACGSLTPFARKDKGKHTGVCKSCFDVDPNTPKWDAHALACTACPKEEFWLNPTPQCLACIPGETVWDKGKRYCVPIKKVLCRSGEKVPEGQPCGMWVSQKLWWDKMVSEEGKCLRDFVPVTLKDDPKVIPRRPYGCSEERFKEKVNDKDYMVLIVPPDYKPPSKLKVACGEWWWLLFIIIFLLLFAFVIQTIRVRSNRFDPDDDDLPPTLPPPLPPISPFRATTPVTPPVIGGGGPTFPPSGAGPSESVSASPPATGPAPSGTSPDDSDGLEEWMSRGDALSRVHEFLGGASGPTPAVTSASARPVTGPLAPLTSAPSSGPEEVHPLTNGRPRRPVALPHPSGRVAQPAEPPPDPPPLKGPNDSLTNALASIGVHGTSQQSASLTSPPVASASGGASPFPLADDPAGPATGEPVPPAPPSKPSVPTTPGGWDAPPPSPLTGGFEQFAPSDTFGVGDTTDIPIVTDRDGILEEPPPEIATKDSIDMEVAEPPPEASPPPSYPQPIAAQQHVGRKCPNCGTISGRETDFHCRFCGVLIIKGEPVQPQAPSPSATHAGASTQLGYSSPPPPPPQPPPLMTVGEANANLSALAGTPPPFRPVNGVNGDFDLHSAVTRPGGPPLSSPRAPLRPNTRRGYAGGLSAEDIITQPERPTPHDRASPRAPAHLSELHTGVAEVAEDDADGSDGGLQRVDTDPGIGVSLLDPLPPPPSNGVKASGGEKSTLAEGVCAGDDRPDRKAEPRREGGVDFSQTFIGEVSSLPGAAIEQHDARGSSSDTEAITQEMDMPHEDAVRDPGPEADIRTALITLTDGEPPPDDNPPRKGRFSRWLGKKK